jgi:DNA repair ATPase RecN
MPRRGYVSITIRKETWEKLQKLKSYLSATTYDELVDKIYEFLIKSKFEDVLQKISEIESRVTTMSRDVEKIYEHDKLIDSLMSEIEVLKTQLSRVQAKLELIEKRGITIEVYLGGEDRIINSQDACDFFQDSSIVYYIKDVGHSLI